MNTVSERKVCGGLPFLLSGELSTLGPLRASLSIRQLRGPLAIRPLRELSAVRPLGRLLAFRWLETVFRGLLALWWLKVPAGPASTEAVCVAGVLLDRAVHLQGVAHILLQLWSGVEDRLGSLRLFLDWGISFGEPYLLPERAARTVAYASKQELEQAISRRCHAQQTESDTPPAPPKAPTARDGASYIQARHAKREPPPPVVVRTDGGQE